MDECHRGSARDDSSWRAILNYFEPAYQLGMTATPLRDETRDTYLYFGNPIYEYSLRQGINDGFLAPYRVHRVVSEWDAVPLMQGTANVSLKEQDIAGVEIELPPLAEQRRVVTQIEELAAQIHEAHTLRHQADKEAEALVPRTTSSLLDDAGWPTSPLGKILAEKPRNGLGPQQEVASGGRKILRINAVSSSPTRYVDMSAAKQVQVPDEIAQQFVIRNDDVFIVRYNGDINRVAKPAICKGANESLVVYPDKLIRLRPDSAKMTPDFLVFALSSDTVRTQIEELGKTTAGNVGVSRGDVQSFVIPVPPLIEQHRIVSELDALQAQVDALQAQVDALKRLQAETADELDALLPAILDRAFKGEL